MLSHIQACLNECFSPLLALRVLAFNRPFASTSGTRVSAARPAHSAVSWGTVLLVSPHPSPNHSSQFSDKPTEETKE